MSTTETEMGAQEAAELENAAQEAEEGAREGGPESKALSEETARKLQSENRSMRERLKQAETKVADFEKQSLTEKERLERDLADRDKKLADANQELRDLRTRAIAAEVGFIDPELAGPLLDWDRIDDPDDQREIKQALREIVKRKPHLVHARDGADGGAGRGQRGGSGSDMNDLIRGGFR
jgi:DNA repair exonuclease SbcCD ATPase subunit